MKKNNKYFNKKKMYKSLIKKKDFELKKCYEQKFKIKNKIINHQIKNGNKRTCENLFLQSLKDFQRRSFKDYKNIIQLAIINTTPIFSLKKIIKKKKKRKKNEIIIPFIPKEKIRVSYSIQNIIIEALKQNHSKKHYKNLTQELFLIADKKSEIIKKKILLQEEALKRKKRLSRFRWF